MESEVTSSDQGGFPWSIVGGDDPDRIAEGSTGLRSTSEASDLPELTLTLVYTLGEGR